MSLPEVQLGILPAWGGTTRLPRLIGLQAALDMLLTGKRVRASKAKRIGLASAVVPAPIFQEAVRDFTLGLIGEKGAPRTRKRSFVQRALDDTPPGTPGRSAHGSEEGPSADGRPLPRPSGDSRRSGTNTEQVGGGRPRGRGARSGKSSSSARSARTSCTSSTCVRRPGKELGCPPGHSAEPRSVSKVGVLGAGVMGGGSRTPGGLSRHRVLDERHRARGGHGGTPARTRPLRQGREAASDERA